MYNSNLWSKSTPRFCVVCKKCWLQLALRTYTCHFLKTKFPVSRCGYSFRVLLHYYLSSEDLEVFYENSLVTRKHDTTTKYSEKPCVVCGLTDRAVCTTTDTDLGSWYHLASCMLTARISQAKNSTQQTVELKYLPAEVLDTVQAVLYTKRHP